MFSSLGDLWPNSISAVGAINTGYLISSIEKLELFLYRRSNAVIALTHSFKKNLISRGVSAEKVFVIRNGVDVNLYCPQERSNRLASEWGIGARFTIGYLGTHGMAHDLRNVLDAAELLLNQHRHSIFIRWRWAERENLLRTAVTRGLHNVIF